MKITGVHEHAEYYPMLSEEQLEELAADIKENGQRDPITVTSDGILIDGRNRWEACKRLGIEPAIEVEDPKDVGAFVRSRNERRHQSTGSRAMSTALSLEHDGKRKNGRWARGSIHGDNTESRVSASGRTWTDAMRQSGLVLDLLPDLAWQVVDGAIALDDAYRQARDEHHKREKARQEAEEDRKNALEAEARAADKFTNDPKARAWLDKKLGEDLAAAWLEGEQESIYATKASAFGSYIAEEESARKEERKRIREQEAAERERRARYERAARRLNQFLEGLTEAWGMRDNPDREHILNCMNKQDSNRFIRFEKETTWPTSAP